MDTVAACLTPAGSGAIATLGVHGPRALEVTRDLFHPGLKTTSKREVPEKPSAADLWLGRLGDELADQVVLSVPELEPVPRVELHCHGGRQVVRLLLEAFGRHGVTVVSWQDWVRRTSVSPLTAEATVALASAPTARTASILLDQQQGALERAFRELAEAAGQGDAARARLLADQLLRWRSLGLHLTVPWRVVIAGPPNVGKSSLVNALAGHRRSVVSDVPGTTRDVVTTQLAVDGWPVELSDTAGLRDAETGLEGEGIGLARDALAGADLRLWLLDGSRMPVWPGPQAGDVRLVINKVDLPAGWDWQTAPDALRVSATTGAGIPELLQALSSWLVPEAPPPGTAVPFTPAQIKFLLDMVGMSNHNQKIDL